MKYFASLKAHAVAIFYAHRDWVKEDPQHAERVKKMIYSLLCAIKKYFSSSPEKEEVAFGNVYKELSKFSLSHEKLREADVPANEVSRLNQYFASLCQESYGIVGYGVATLYSVVLVSLDNIQEDLENPYDSAGADDVNLDVVDKYMEVMQSN